MVGVTYERHASTSSASTSAYEPLIAREDSETSSETLHSPIVVEGITSVFHKEFEADDVNIGPRFKARSQQVSNLSYRQAQWLTALLIITLGLTLFNAVLLIFPKTLPPHNSQGVVVDDEDPLPTPDAYIGLRKMLRLEGWKESLQPFYNFPLEVALVDKTRPNDAIPNGRTIAHVNKTVIVPDNRHVVVNNDVSTILQFYTLEFGFENCQITFSLPSGHSLSSTSNSHPSPSTIDVFLLSNPHSRTSISDAVLPLSESLTYATCPSRTVHLGTLNLPSSAEGDGNGFEARSQTFKCEERVVQTVELVCSDGSVCDVDLWMDKYDEGPIIGFRMLQHPSL